MTQPLTTNRICEHLEKYIYDRIWDNPYQEYRTFIVPTLLNTVPAKGVFFGRYSRIGLPSESAKGFYLYSVNANFFRGLTLNVPKWIQLDEYCTTNLIDLRLFTNGGRNLWRHAIWVRQSLENDCLLVAVDAGMFETCCGTATPQEVIFEKYFDSDLNPDNMVNCYTLTSKDVRIEDPAVDPLQKGEGTYTFYDGRLVTGRTNLENLIANHYVERVYDEDILGTFDVEGSVNPPVYISAEGGTRLLVHIPKAINKENIILTANTFEIYMVKQGPVRGPECVCGIDVYMCGRGEHFHQLTHNDFSIDYEFLTDLAAANNMDKFSIRVLVRKHGKSKVPIRDANYINLLYSHDDEQIVKFLLGQHEVSIPFWKADHLEDGVYADALVRRHHDHPTPDVQCATCANKTNCKDYPNKSTVCVGFSHRGLKDYIDILGYHHVAALIGKHVTHFELENTVEGDGVFIVKAPIGLQDVDAMSYIPLVYHNGNKVPQDKVKVIYGFGTNWEMKELEFSDKAIFGQNVIVDNYSTRVLVSVHDTFKKGDKVCIDLVDVGDQTVRKFVNKAKVFKCITSTTQRFIKGTKYYFRIGLSDMYELVPNTDELAGEKIPPNTYYTMENNQEPLVIVMKNDDWTVYRMSYVSEHEDEEGHLHDASVAFAKWDDPGVYDEATKTLVVDTSAGEDLNLIVVEGSLGVHEEHKFQLKKTTMDVLGKDIWPASYNDVTKEIKGEYPFVSDIVFLNDKRLIRGLDYSMEGYGAISKNARIFLQSVSYLKANENKIDTFRTMMSDLYIFRGFMGGRQIYWTNQELFWFDELSTLTIDGKVCSDIVHSIGQISVTCKDHRNGSPFEVRTSVPNRIRLLMNEYHRTEDIARMKTLMDYFNSVTQRKPYITIVPHSHKIYSIYLERIIADYLNGKFIMGEWPVIYEQLRLNYYQWKARDVAYNLSELDKKFVDIYPTYNRLAVTRDQYRKITELVKLLLPTDPIKHKDDANV